MRKNHTSFIIFCIATTFCFLFFGIVFFFFAMSSPFPETSPVYENCTFLSYEHVRRVGGKTTNHYYYIYTEEYDKPLVIDNIAFRSAYAEALDSLRKGDVLTVSIDHDRERLDLFAIAYNETPIMTYEDYEEAHTDNRTLGYIILPILSGGSLFFLITGSIFYKKKGRIPFT
ncbi:MAG: hypothetical protein IKC63_05135 [Clostridia bacterium]|nr:hypothetical protein [Clostridia bacterium]